MTRHYSRMLAISVVLMSLGCEEPRADDESAPARDTAADRQAIEKVREREIGAFVAGAPDSGAAIVTIDVVMMPPNEAAITGRDNVRAWLKRTIDQYRVNGRYTDADISVLGDWAIERYDGELTLTPKAGGRAMQESIKGIHIYRRQPDGSWLIAQDVWNSNGAPPAPASR
jgi:ketosteroid isomerase-like protein